MDGLEAQYGGYFIKNIRKLAFFEKKMLKNLQVSKNILNLLAELKNRLKISIFLWRKSCASR